MVHIIQILINIWLNNLIMYTIFLNDIIADQTFIAEENEIVESLKKPWETKTAQNEYFLVL